MVVNANNLRKHNSGVQVDIPVSYFFLEDLFQTVIALYGQWLFSKQILFSKVISMTYYVMQVFGSF